MIPLKKYTYNELQEFTNSFLLELIQGNYVHSETRRIAKEILALW